MPPQNQRDRPGPRWAAAFTARGLSPGAHTLTIEVTHERDAHTAGSWVWIDGFNIENGTAVPGGVSAPGGRVEENNPALVYTGRWYSNSNPAHSGGTAALTNTRGARATLSFTGTGIMWNGVADGWAGLATVFLDGKMTVVDSYAATAAYQRALYAVHGLPAGGDVQ